MNLKAEKYQTILSIVPSVLEGEKNLIANLANTVAILKEHLNYFWIGFYLVEKESNQLVLGPFQGTLACTRIGYGRGVCGESWKQKRSLVVTDVHQFPGHIACSSLSNSEIVVPIFKESEVVAILDLDSTEFNHFDEIDRQNLEKLAKQLSHCF